MAMHETEVEHAAAEAAVSGVQQRTNRPVMLAGLFGATAVVASSCSLSDVSTIISILRLFGIL